MKVKFKSYDGSYPNLCSGNLVITVDGTDWSFPSRCLSSGGGVWFDDGWTEHVDEGLWSIRDWPEGYPEEAKHDTLDVVNDSIEFGCCGGCV